MNQRQIGIILMILGILVAGMVFAFKEQVDSAMLASMEGTGPTCFTPDGVCIHEQNATSIALGFSLSVVIFLLGLYLTFFDKTQEKLAQQQVLVAKALALASEKESEKSKFSSFLAGFSLDEQSVLKAVHKQEGVTQSTLRFKTGLSKTSLSLILQSLEDREFITRKPSGKTKSVFLRNKF